MNHNDLEADIRNRLMQTADGLASLTPEIVLSAFVDQYREIRVDAVDSGQRDADMLLDQWGTYDWRSLGGRAFEWNVTRQVSVLQEPGPDGIVLYQLAVTLRYAVSAANAQIRMGNAWCFGLPDVDVWSSRARSEVAFRVASLETPIGSRIDYHEAE